MKFAISACLILLLYQQNNPPTVKISVPKPDATYTWETSLRYSVQVTDKEDGDTRYDEIPSTAILLEARAVDDTAQSSTYRTKRSVVHAMMASNCMNCHTFNAKLIGPSFSDISKKAPEVSQLVMHVKNGSRGVWGDLVMPSHPELSDEEIGNMVRWILDYGKQKNVAFYTGTEGAVRLEKPATASPKTKLLLTASYLDKGKVTGEQSLLLKVVD